MKFLVPATIEVLNRSDVLKPLLPDPVKTVVLDVAPVLAMGRNKETRKYGYYRVNPPHPGLVRRGPFGLAGLDPCGAAPPAGRGGAAGLVLEHARVVESNPILGWLVVTLVHDGLVAAARVLEGGPAGLAGGVGPVEKSKEPDPEGHEHDMEDRHLEALLPVDRRDEVGPQGRLAV